DIDVFGKLPAGIESSGQNDLGPAGRDDRAARRAEAADLFGPAERDDGAEGSAARGDQISAAEHLAKVKQEQSAARNNGTARRTVGKHLLRAAIADRGSPDDAIRIDGLQTENRGAHRVAALGRLRTAAVDHRAEIGADAVDASSREVF